MRVQVTDFQVVKKVDIEGDGFIVIKGKSSSGKSSTIKALYAALFNRFTSTQVRYGESAAIIKLKWDKNSPLLKVVRKSTGGSPLMSLGESSWSKLTRSLPKEIEEYNNLGNLEVGSSTYSLNFCTQFSKPMLLEFSQKRVMEILSASRGLDDLLKVKSQLSLNKEKNSGAFAEVDSILNEAKAKVSQIKFLVQERSAIISELDSVFSELQSLEAKRELYFKLEVLLNDISRFEKTLSSLIEVTQCLSTLETNHNTLSNLTALVDSLSTIDNCNNKLSTVDSSIEALQVLQSENDNLLSLKDKHHKLLELVKHLQSIKSFSDIKSNNDHKILLLQEVQEVKDNVQVYQSKLVDLESLKMTIEFKNTCSDRIDSINSIFNNNLCPCCGQPIH